MRSYTALGVEDDEEDETVLSYILLDDRELGSAKSYIAAKISRTPKGWSLLPLRRPEVVIFNLSDRVLVLTTSIE